MKYINYLAAGAFLGALAVAMPAGAVKAYPGVTKVTLPDGSVAEITCQGDERGHELYSTRGELLMYDAEGFLTYATVADGKIIPSDLRFNTVATRSGDVVESAVPALSAPLRQALEAKHKAIGEKPKYLFTGTSFPATGTPDALVFIVEFQDKEFSMENPAEFYDEFLNGEHFTTYGATGSVRKFFVENSMGLFQPHFDVLGPVKLAHERSYYGANDWFGNDKHAEDMVFEAIEAVAPTTDFSKYDHDGDGFIDNIFVIYAGTGEATSDKENDVWPHSADLIGDLKYNESELPEHNGVKPNRYGCTNEWQTRLNRPDGIGTFVHEFSHVLGLPDLYNTVNSNVKYTPGEWSVLDAGPYNNDGRTPPNYSIFERFSLNWINPTELTATGDYTLPLIADTNEGYIIYTDTADEFFFLECRDLKGNDAYLPGRGMLVWHLAFDQTKWDRNVVNNGQFRQLVDIIEANNNVNQHTGFTFPGTSHKTSLGFETTPAMMPWSKNTTGVELSEIAYDDVKSEISFHAEVDEEVVNSILNKFDTGVDAIGKTPSGFYTAVGAIFSRRESAPVYDTMGRLVGRVTPDVPLSLAPGLYIVAGEKLIVK